MLLEPNRTEAELVRKSQLAHPSSGYSVKKPEFAKAGACLFPDTEFPDIEVTTPFFPIFHSGDVARRICAAVPYPPSADGSAWLGRRSEACGAGSARTGRSGGLGHSEAPEGRLHGGPPGPHPGPCTFSEALATLFT